MIVLYKTKFLASFIQVKPECLISRDLKNKTLLDWAVQKSESESTKFLLQEINIPKFTYRQQDIYFSALSIATENIDYGTLKVDIIKMLLEVGAVPILRRNENEFDLTPFINASQNVSDTYLKLLYEKFPLEKGILSKNECLQIKDRLMLEAISHFRVKNIAFLHEKNCTFPTDFINEHLSQSCLDIYFQKYVPTINYFLTQNVVTENTLKKLQDRVYFVFSKKKQGFQFIDYNKVKECALNIKNSIYEKNLSNLEKGNQKEWNASFLSYLSAEEAANCFAE